MASCVRAFGIWGSLFLRHSISHFMSVICRCRNRERAAVANDKRKMGSGNASYLPALLLRPGEWTMSSLGQYRFRGLRRSASRQRLQSRDAILGRGVRAEEVGDSAAGKRVDDEQMRGLRVAGVDRNLFAPTVNLTQRAGERERVVRQTRAGLVGYVFA